MTAWYYPFVEAGLVVDEKMAFVDPMDKPLLYASEDNAIKVILPFKLTCGISTDVSKVSRASKKICKSQAGNE